MTSTNGCSDWSKWMILKETIQAEARTETRTRTRTRTEAMKKTPGNGSVRTKEISKIRPNGCRRKRWPNGRRIDVAISVEEKAIFRRNVVLDGGQTPPNNHQPRRIDQKEQPMPHLAREKPKVPGLRLPATASIPLDGNTSLQKRSPKRPTKRSAKCPTKRSPERYTKCFIKTPANEPPTRAIIDYQRTDRRNHSQSHR